MAPLTWILSFISYMILAECHPPGSLLPRQEHHRFHMIPKLPPPHFPHNFFGDVITKDPFNQFKPFDVTPKPLVNQQNGDTVHEVHGNNINSVLKKVSKEEIKESDVTEPSTAVEDITPEVNTEEIPEISEKPEDVKLSVKQPLQELQEKELISDSKLESAKVNAKVNTDGKSDSDTKNKDPGLTKNTDYVLIPVATVNQVPNQLNPNVGNSAYSDVVQNTVIQALPVGTTEGIVPLSNMNQDSKQGNNQSNQLGIVLPQNQNFVPVNNIPNGAMNNGETQPLYVVPNNVATSGNNVPNNMYYVTNNAPANNMGTQGISPTPAYKLVPLAYQQNNQPSNMVAANNLPNNYVAIPNQNNMVPSSNQPYLVSLNNQQTYPNGYIIQPNVLNNQQNNPNGILPNNLNNQQYNPNSYVVQPNNFNNLNNQQTYPNGYVIQPNNLNNQQNNPMGYLVQPNNLNNQPNNPNSYVILPNNSNNPQINPNSYLVQPNNLNGNLQNNPNSYLVQPNNLNNQPNNPTSYVILPNNSNNPQINTNSYLVQPNNLNNPQINPNSYLVQPNNLNNLQNNPNSYLVQPNNSNNPQINPNSYLVQPNNMNNLNNQPTNPNGNSYQPNNLVVYTNQPNNLVPTNNANNAVLMQTSDYNGNTAAIPLFSFKEEGDRDKNEDKVEDKVEDKDEDKKEDVKELKDEEKDVIKQEE